MNLKGSVQDEKSKTQEDKYFMISLTCRKQNKIKFLKAEQNGACQALGQWRKWDIGKKGMMFQLYKMSKF